LKFIEVSRFTSSNTSIYYLLPIGILTSSSLQTQALSKPWAILFKAHLLPQKSLISPRQEKPLLPTLGCLPTQSIHSDSTRFTSTRLFPDTGSPVSDYPALPVETWILDCTRKLLSCEWSHSSGIPFGAARRNIAWCGCNQSQDSSPLVRKILPIQFQFRYYSGQVRYSPLCLAVRVPAVVWHHDRASKFFCATKLNHIKFRRTPVLT